MSHPARLLALAALVVVAVAGPMSIPGALSTASAGSYSGYCTSSTGVTVVVDFQQLGGGVVIRCDASATSSTSGSNALVGAGFDPTGTHAYGLAFICKIEGKPTNQTCISTPPTTAYWGYWHASNGGSWTYSNEGAAARDVTVGGFEGWSFSLNHTSTTAPAPGVSPRRPAPPAPKPSHSSSSSSTHSSGSHASSSSGSHSSSGSSTSAGSKSTATGSPSATASGSATTAADPTSTDGSGGAVVAGGQSDPPAGGSSGHGAGGLVTFLIGLGVVALLAGGGVIYARARSAPTRSFGGS